MQIKAYAKINLALDVLGKSGKYHRIRTVFQQINLYDILVFKRIGSSKKITIKCDDAAVPTGPANTVFKAISLLREAAARPSLRKNICGLQITIKKNIPVAAGLGGGSSDAAATLVAINKIWKLGLSKNRLSTLAAKIGMDTPFFLHGGTALGTHYGEKISPLARPPALKNLPILIAMAGKKTSSKNVYSRLDLSKTGKNKALTGQLISMLSTSNVGPTSNVNIKCRANIKCCLPLFHNDFEVAVPGQQAKIKAFQKKLLHSGALIVHICGSGPALYAIYPNHAAAQKAYLRLNRSCKIIKTTL
jgi:4-diphosphocytidyl-2-C-methyl-D-erythritol kinase